MVANTVTLTGTLALVAAKLPTALVDSVFPGTSFQSLVVFSRNKDCLYWAQHWVRKSCVTCGSRNSSVVRAPDSWSKGGGVGEFSSPGSTFCADSYFGIHYWSFCQKCTWQVTLKCIHLLYVALHEVTWCMVVTCMVYTECTKMAAVSCGTCLPVL